VHLSDSTVREYCHRFQQGGIDAVRSKPCMGGTTKLKPEEIRSVGAVVLAKPKIRLSELCARIEAEFGIRYTPAGLKNMLKKQLGIIHRATAFQPDPAAHPRQQT
jgi:transposase